MTGKPESGRRWISPAEAAARLGIHAQTAYAWAATGRLPSARIGRKVFVDWPKVEAELERQAAGQQGGGR